MNAVVLVSGFTTSTPFSTSAANCAGQEGSTWSVNVAPTLKQAGQLVFTAPEADGTNAPAPCVGTGQQAPPASATIDTGGDVDANGKALATLLAFLRDNYSVTTVQLVGHSDGGIWSRSAITQSSAYANGLTVQSLTTLGTPHTGSFAADLIEELNGATCDFSNWIEQDVCDFFEDVLSVVSQELGPTAIQELTNTYMATWNPLQNIGSCAVTTVGGTYVTVPLVGRFLPYYYNPSDGVVGQASALAQSSDTILFSPIAAPRFTTLVNGGTFPVVHSPSLSFFTPNNLLNQNAITAVVLSAVQAGTSNAVPCNTSTASASLSSPRTLIVPLLTVIPIPPGAGTTTTRGDVLVAERTTKVSCGGRSLGGPGTSSIVVAGLTECSGPIRAKGGPAILLRPEAQRRVTMELSGSRLTVRLHGKPARLTAQLRSGKRWRTVKLDGKGRVTLPKGEKTTKVRVLALQPGRTKGSWAVATLAR